MKMHHIDVHIMCVCCVSLLIDSDSELHLPACLLVSQAHGLCSSQDLKGIYLIWVLHKCRIGIEARHYMC